MALDATPSALAPTVATSHRSSRLRTTDGAETTLHEARFDRFRIGVRVVALNPPAKLAEWCRRAGAADAMIGGFFVRDGGTPLGELWIGGERMRSVPFDSPWHRLRACVGIDGARVTLGSRSEHEVRPRGDLLQAGPLLVRDRQILLEAGSDPEGFSAGKRQFDSDITAGRYARAALGLNDDELIVAVCDGRGEHDQGLTLEEMGRAMLDLGATEAINLDGGGSASLVLGGRLANRPREELGVDLIGGRPISTALVFEAI